MSGQQGTSSPPTPPPAPAPSSGGSGPAAVLLGLLVVVATPMVLLPALIVRAVLTRRWPDRAVAGLLAVLGAAGVAGVLLASSYVSTWLHVGRWLLWEVNPWARVPVEQPSTAAWLLLAGTGLAAGTVYGALRWWSMQTAAEADLYDGRDERERRMRVEERRRRKVAQRVQRVSRASRLGVLRAAAAPLAVPLGDARGPFVGVYQHGTLGGHRIELRRRPEDRLWRSGSSVRVPLGSGSPVQHLVVLGATGTGKTETTLRLCDWALSRRWQVIYVSAKEPPSRQEAAAPRLTPTSDQLGQSSRVLLPDVSPFDAMRGDLDDVRDRLLAMEPWSEPYYEHAGNLLLAIALETGVPVSGLADLVSSLTPARMRAQSAASGDPRVAEVVAALEDRTVAGALMRYASLAVSLRGWVGQGPGSSSWAWEDADLCVAELPMGTKPKAGRALMRLMVRDLGAYLFDPVRRRTLPDGSRQPMLLVVEEVGALAADPVVGPEFVNLVERARSAGAVCVLSAQDPLGLGDDRVQSAVLTNAATLTFRQTTQAEAVAQLVGTGDQRVDEASKTYDESGLGTGGSTRKQYAMDLNPQELRRFGLGEAALIALGKVCTLAAVQPDSGYPSRGTRGTRPSASPEPAAPLPAAAQEPPAAAQQPAEPEPSAEPAAAAVVVVQQLTEPSAPLELETGHELRGETDRRTHQRPETGDDDWT